MVFFVKFKITFLLIIISSFLNSYYHKFINHLNVENSIWNIFFLEVFKRMILSDWIIEFSVLTAYN